jgi:galactoside O-acetyltransferase
MTAPGSARTMRERIATGRLFTDDCEGLPEERAAAKQAMTRYNTADLGDGELRAQLLADLLHVTPQQAATIWVEPPFGCAYGSHIEIGAGSYVNMNCMFVDDGAITIGERVMMGPSITLATTSHPIAPSRRGYMFCDPIVIGDDTWIGSGVTICPGVSIGAGSVIGAGAVVTKDIPAGVVAVGNPCRVLREITAEDEACYRPGVPFDPEDLEQERRLRG